MFLFLIHLFYFLYHLDYLVFHLIHFHHYLLIFLLMIMFLLNYCVKDYSFQHIFLYLLIHYLCLLQVIHCSIYFLLLIFFLVLLFYLLYFLSQSDLPIILSFSNKLFKLAFISLISIAIILAPSITNQLIKFKNSLICINYYFI